MLTCIILKIQYEGYKIFMRTIFKSKDYLNAEKRVYSHNDADCDYYKIEYKKEVAYFWRALLMNKFQTYMPIKFSEDFINRISGDEYNDCANYVSCSISHINEMRARTKISYDVKKGYVFKKNLNQSYSESKLKIRRLKECLGKKLSSHLLRGTFLVYTIMKTCFLNKLPNLDQDTYDKIVIINPLAEKYYNTNKYGSYVPTSKFNKANIQLLGKEAIEVIVIFMLMRSMRIFKILDKKV